MTESSSGEEGSGDEEAHLYLDPVSGSDQPRGPVEHEHIRQVVDNVFRNLENRDQNRFDRLRGTFFC